MTPRELFQLIARLENDLADQLEALSREEFDHRDYILGKENN